MAMPTGCGYGFPVTDTVAGTEKYYAVSGRVGIMSIHYYYNNVQIFYYIILFLRVVLLFTANTAIECTIALRC